MTHSNYIRFSSPEGKVTKVFICDIDTTYTNECFMQDLQTAINSVVGTFSEDIIINAVMSKLPVTEIPASVITKTMTADSMRFNFNVSPTCIVCYQFAVKEVIKGENIHLKWYKQRKFAERDKRVSLDNIRCNLPTSTLYLEFSCSAINKDVERFVIPLTPQEGYYTEKPSGEHAFIRTAGAFKSGALTEEEMHRIYDIINARLTASQPNWAQYEYHEFLYAMYHADLARLYYEK